MIFNTSLFILFILPIIIFIHVLLSPKYKNLFLLIISISFYAWGAPQFIPYLMASVIIDFYMIKILSESKIISRKFLLWASIFLNIGILLYFKYMNFFIEQFNSMNLFGSLSFSWLHLAMPIGISFITFQKLAYTFDVYRNATSPFKRIQDYALYIFMFPQMIAGPIVRPGQIAEQISNKNLHNTSDDILLGLNRFILGLAKKVLIADVLAQHVNQIFALNPTQLTTGLAWVGALSYTFQIYFDFSGYSDMAIGLARIFGFKIPENFNNPYISGSITEFWKRWHMTLSFWFRDYVFMPLANATSNKLKHENYFNIKTDKIIYFITALTTFIFCGFWHGAAWTFILWGLYQGLFIIFDRLFLLKFFKKIGKVPSQVITFIIIILGWVLFRSKNLNGFYLYIQKMFIFKMSNQNDVWLNPKFTTMFLIAVFFSFWGGFNKISKLQEKLFTTPKTIEFIGFSILSILLLILSISSLASTSFSPFIYFRF